jgi:hypothetical protein
VQNWRRHESAGIARAASVVVIGYVSKPKRWSSTPDRFAPVSPRSHDQGWEAKERLQVALANLGG